MLGHKKADGQTQKPAHTSDAAPQLWQPTRLVLLAIFILLFSASVVWFAWYTRQPSDNANFSGPAEHIKVGNIGEYSIFNLIAKEKGYFAANGLDVDITEYPSGPPAVADLLRGKNDFAIAADLVGVNALFTNKQLRILSQVSQQHVFYLIVRKDKGIAKPADLRGKKIGVTKKGAGEFFLSRYLNLNGMTTADITVADLSPTDMMIQLSSGQADGIVIFEPHVYDLIQSMGGNITVFAIQGEQPTVGLAYTTEYFTTQKPEVVRRYVASLLAAQTFLKEHDQEARQILARAMNYDIAYVNYLWPKIDFSLTLRQSLLIGMEDEARFLIQEHLADQTTAPNFRNYIYFDALKQLDPQAVTISR